MHGRTQASYGWWDKRSSALLSAEMDPGGAVGVRGHLRPVPDHILSARRFGLWPPPFPKLAYFRPLSALWSARNRSGVVELVGKQLNASFSAAICERQIVHSSPIPAIFRQGRLRRPGAQSLRAANAAHTVNGPNARSVQFTFACVAMTGEV